MPLLAYCRLRRTWLTARQELDTSVVISNVDIAKFDGEREYSSKLLKDLQTIFLVEVCLASPPLLLGLFRTARLLACEADLGVVGRSADLYRLEGEG